MIFNQPTEAKMNKQQRIKLGESVAEFLGLKLDKDKRYATTWGTKTAEGLGACIQRLVKESQS